MDMWMIIAVVAICLVPLVYLVSGRQAVLLRSELGQLKAETANKELQLQQLRADMAEETEQLQQLQIVHSRIQAEREAVQAQYQVVQQQLSQLKVQQDQMAAEYNAQREQYAATGAALEALKPQLAATQSKLLQTEKTLVDAQQQSGLLQTQYAEIKTQCDAVLSERAELQTLRQQLQAETVVLRQKLGQKEQEYSHATALLEAKEHNLAELTQRHQLTVTQLDSASTELHAVKQQFGELNTRLAEKELHFAQQLQLLADSKAELKREFETLANEILERKGAQFKELNRESVAGLINPIHEELKGFKNKVETIHQQETEQRVKLRTELENLQTLNKQITDQADKLTKALKGEKKVQGNWGELMLENVLDNSGLRLGVDYEREVHLADEEGRYRPDVVVHLPQQKHLIIDAKTSLNAYTRFVNAEDEMERQLALKEHAAAVKARINELAQKDYARLPGINSPEVVVMFIPIESAYVEALRADETIFQRAIEQKILVATPTTLLTSLNIVRQLWRFEEQNKHTAELANRAERFYTKLNSFLESMQGVGKQLDKARSTYDDAVKLLCTGKGNLIAQASQFRELGVAVSKELPAELVKVAKLELEHGTELLEMGQA
jgi:DNA recombination protein RmuC